MPNALNPDVERVGVDEPEHQRPEHYARETARRAQRAQPLADPLDQADNPVGEPTGRQDPPYQPLGGKREGDDQDRAQERHGYHCPRGLRGVGHGHPADRDTRRQVGCEKRESHESQHGEAVEDALHCQRGEGRAESNPGEPGRDDEPNQLTGPERKQVVGHEADRHRVPERGRRDRPSVLVAQEQTPAHEAQGEGERGENDGREQRPGAGGADVVQDVVQVNAA